MVLVLQMMLTTYSVHEISSCLSFLLINRGANPLEHKPELQKEMERRKLDKQKKEVQEKLKNNRTSFEQKLDMQYDKLKSVS